MINVRRLAYTSVLTLGFVAMAGLFSKGAVPEIWTVQGIDPMGDAPAGSSLDAAQLSSRYDAGDDVLWFRVALYRKPDETAFEVSVAINTGGDSGARVVTASITRRDGRYHGALRLEKAGTVTALAGNAWLRVDDDAVVIGVKRAAVSEGMKLDVVASVGVDRERGDRVPNARPASLDLAAPRPVRGLRELDVMRNNFRFAADVKVLADDRPPSIAKHGRGGTAFILVPGVYSGSGAFQELIARHQSRDTLFVVVPPGLDGTPARALPPETTSYGEFTWTRRLARDILALIDNEQLRKPVLVVHGFPGSLAAVEVAARHPEALGGIVELASMPRQPFPTMTDPTGRLQATPDQRVAIVDAAWAAQWFKYVTPETWESNNYPAEMFANDPERGEQVRRQVEAVPLPVKIRYLTEFMASDHGRELAALKVPVLALRPGFDDDLLKNPAFGFFKPFFLDAWDAFAGGMIQVVTIPHARARLFDDQPARIDDEIVRFVDRAVVGSGKP